MVILFCCRVCSYGFPAKKGLQIHLDRVHQARPIIPLDVIEEIEGQDYLHTINGEYEGREMWDWGGWGGEI